MYATQDYHFNSNKFLNDYSPSKRKSMLTNPQLPLIIKTTQEIPSHYNNDHASNSTTTFKTEHIYASPSLTRVDAELEIKKSKYKSDNTGLMHTGSSSSGISSSRDSNSPTLVKKMATMHIQQDDDKGDIVLLNPADISIINGKLTQLRKSSPGSDGSMGSRNGIESDPGEKEHVKIRKLKQDCNAPCHHKCKTGITCKRHGQKILARIKRRAEKEQQRAKRNLAQVEEQHKKHLATQSPQVAQKKKKHEHDLKNVINHVHIEHQKSMQQMMAPKAVKSTPTPTPVAKPTGKPPPVKSVVPPTVPKHQQNGFNTIKELTFVDPNFGAGIKDQFFKKYKIYSVIGIGGGGTVYAGRRSGDYAPIAIKRVMRGKVKRWEKLSQGRAVPQEIALMLRSSNNMGIISLYDWFETSDSYLLILERPENSIDLFDYIREVGPVAPNIARHILINILYAVKHLASCKIIHRDIKDENVLLDRSTGAVKLIDFGCGTHWKDAAYTEFSGTAEFYPPEWFAERRYWAQSATVWSLGVLLFDMLQGEIPFKNSDRILENRPVYRETISSSAKDLIQWMLNNDPRQRPTFSQVLAHPWIKEQSEINAVTSF